MSKERTPIQSNEERWPQPWSDDPALDSTPQDRALRQTAGALAEQVPQAPLGVSQRILDRITAPAARRTSLLRPVFAGLFAGAVAVVAGVIVTGIFDRASPPNTGFRRLTFLQGTGDGVSQDGTPPGEALAVADIGAGGRILFHREASLSMDPEEQAAGRLNLQLNAGEVVVNRPPVRQQEIIIQTPHAEVQVKGTVYAVRVEPSKTDVSVWHGSVVVNAGDHRRVVRAGEQSSSIDRFASVTRHRELAAGERKLLGLAPVPRTEPDPVPVPNPVAPALAVRRATAEPVIDEADDDGHQAPNPETETTAPMTGERPRAKSPAERLPRSPAIPPQETDREVDRSPEDDGSPALLAEQEQRLKLLSEDDGETGANALFALGALRYDLLDKPRSAQRAWEAYLKRFPDGAMVGEVQLALFEHFRTQGDDSRAVSHGEKALLVLGDSRRAAELRLAMGRVFHLRLKEPREAIPHYRVVSRRTDRIGDQTSYLLIDCYQQLGTPEKVRDAIRDYLKRFPKGTHRAQVEAAMKKHEAEGE